MATFYKDLLCQKRGLSTSDEEYFSSVPSFYKDVLYQERGLSTSDEEYSSSAPSFYKDRLCQKRGLSTSGEEYSSSFPSAKRYHLNEERPPSPLPPVKNEEESEGNDEECPPSPLAPAETEEESEEEASSSLTLGKEDARLKDYVILKLLWTSRLNRVWRAEERKGRDQVAIKRVEKGDRNETARLQKEIRALTELSGEDFIVRVHQTIHTPAYVFFVMDYAHGGDLRKLIQRQSSLQQYLSEEDARFYLSELVMALQTVHERFIVHRDLKPANILLDRAGHVTLADFGLCEFLDNKEEGRQSWRCGTGEYRAPEVFMPWKLVPGCEFARDWYAVGVIALHMICGENYLPYGEQIGGDFSHMLWGNVEDNLIRGMQDGVPNIPMSVSDSLQDLLRQLLEVNCDLRLGASQIRNHPFFQDVDWDDVADKIIPSPHF